MGRPKKEIGNYQYIECAKCGKKTMQGFKVDLSIQEVEITPDFFIARDPEIDDYDMFICSKECLWAYVKELMKNGHGESRHNGSG